VQLELTDVKMQNQFRIPTHATPAQILERLGRLWLGVILEDKTHTVTAPCDDGDQIVPGFFCVHISAFSFFFKTKKQPPFFSVAASSLQICGLATSTTKRHATHVV